MNKSSRFIVLLILIIAALASYSIGFARGTALFIIIGILFEAAFWTGLLRSNPDKREG